MSEWNRRKWTWRGLVAAGVLFLLGGSVFAARAPLERGLIAYRICQAGIFTPPPPVEGESRWIRGWHNARFYWDFSAMRTARNQRLKELNPELRPLIRELGRHQAAGENMQYSMHVYRAIRWRLNFTPDVASTRARMRDLQTSLDRPDEQAQATRQVPEDGSWSMGIDPSVWYLRLYYTVEDGLTRDHDPEYPLHILDRINSPEKLNGQLNSALYDDFTRTGEFKREELDETASAIMRLLYGHKRTGYTFDPRLGDAMRDYLNKWQNPATGCWGQWAVDRYGRVWKMDDTGITFHVISDLHGQVQHLDRIALRLVDLEKLDYPAGPRMDGRYENHLSWDMVIVFRYAWPSLDEPARARVREQISKMLDSCLQSLQPDGSFRTSEIDDTVGDANMYGAWLLRDAGDFDPAKRFWTDENFPNAAQVRARIKTRLETMGLADPSLKSAYDAVTTGN
ncbi:MAG TPA: hypothetical protein VGJ21_04885 [Terracidiphilus sp.]